MLVLQKKKIEQREETNIIKGRRYVCIYIGDLRSQDRQASKDCWCQRKRIHDLNSKNFKFINFITFLKL